jgi:hypothetical protein
VASRSCLKEYNYVQIWRLYGTQTQQETKIKLFTQKIIIIIIIIIIIKGKWAKQRMKGKWAIIDIHFLNCGIPK